MSIFDTHAHYDDSQFDEDRDELLKSLNKGGVKLVVNVGASMRSSRQTVELTKKYDFVYGAVGVHPESLDGMTDECLNEIEAMTHQEKIVAIGEIGLDYHYDEPDRDIQKEWFIRQINLARKLKLPMIIHSRDAAEDTLKIMKEQHCEEIGGVIHCFSYSSEMASEYLKMGFYIGIGGVVTFKNGKKLKEVADMTPLDRIVIETDCPYLAPTPNRGKRNSSLYLPLVIEELAQIKGIAPNELEDIVYENGLKLYRMNK